MSKINKGSAFKIDEHLIIIPKSKKDKFGNWTTIEMKYLEVKWRIYGFATDYLPWGWRLITEELPSEMIKDIPVAKFKATVFDPDDKIVATGHGLVRRDQFDRYYEKAETAAVGRALALIGLGTQYAEELNEDVEAFDMTDSPVETKPKSEPGKPKFDILTATRAINKVTNPTVLAKKRDEVENSDILSEAQKKTVMGAIDKRSQELLALEGSPKEGPEELSDEDLNKPTNPNY